MNVSQDLFKKVVPYHCLGGIWSQRDKKGKEHLAPTIRATVAQFNSVTNCVITTCLSNPTLKPNQRARLLERWIDVARVSAFTRREKDPFYQTEKVLAQFVVSVSDGTVVRVVFRSVGS